MPDKKNIKDFKIDNTENIVSLCVFGSYNTEFWDENRSDIDISNKVYQLLWKDFRTIFPSKTKFPRNSSLEGAVRTLLKDIDVANFPKYNTASIII